MRAFFAVIFILASATIAQAQVECPMGAGKTTLTIQRVMMNFGKYTTKADDIAIALPNQPEVSDADIAAAVADLGVVEACAEAVVNGTSDELWPSKAFDLKGIDRDQFLTQFHSMMKLFEDAIAKYADTLSQSNGRLPRDLSAAIAQKQAVNDLVDQAHKFF